LYLPVRIRPLRSKQSGDRAEGIAEPCPRDAADVRREHGGDGADPGQRDAAAARSLVRRHRRDPDRVN